MAQATEEPALEAIPPAEGEDNILSAASDEVLRLQLDRFEGPFEVLLHLIKVQEIDIFDIPIVKITEQYLAFLGQMQADNLDVAGEFIVMAATLIQIKSRMILPLDVPTEEDEEIEEEDPRLELVEKLLEYRRFRDFAEALARRGERAQDRYGRRVRYDFGPDEEEDDAQEMLDLGIYDLLTAVRKVMRFVFEAPMHQVEMEGASVEEKIELLEALLTEYGTTSWTDLRKGCRARIEAICCILAILELCRLRRVRVHQHHSYGEIRLFQRRVENDTITDAENAVIAEGRAYAEEYEAARARRDAEMRAEMEARMAERAAEEEARKQELIEAALSAEKEAEESRRKQPRKKAPVLHDEAAAPDEAGGETMEAGEESKNIAVVEEDDDDEYDPGPEDEYDDDDDDEDDDIAWDDDSDDDEEEGGGDEGGEGEDDDEEEDK